MSAYIGIVHQDADSAYGVTFPDAPGCFGASDDLDELFIGAEEALGLWLETAHDVKAPVPQPRGLSALKLDPDWASAFDEAAFVIAVQSPLLPLRTAA